MQEQKPVYDVLHLLKVLHPEKSFTELHQLLRFAAVRHRDVRPVRLAGPFSSSCVVLDVLRALHL